jgi:sterol desaturase/sphingolipid hydroxylase (fatty acid hydroxylase superfamily)
MILITILLIGVGMIAVEKFWPANDLPRVRAWWPRVVLINCIQLGMVIVAGITWDRWLQGYSVVKISRHLSLIPAAAITYIAVTFIYYWWHRIRHESKLFWLLCHQLHHSPARIEVVTSFYKHPVEITVNSILSSMIAYPLMGCNIQAAALTTFMTAIAEFLYHWNIKTPFWVGRLFQRPESHRVHHMYRHHTQNFADLPVWDMLFGTYRNPKNPIPRCGFDPDKEDRFEDILTFRDLHDEKAAVKDPLHFLPTCIGCSKRWACRENNGDLTKTPHNS